MGANNYYILSVYYHHSCDRLLIPSLMVHGLNEYDMGGDRGFERE